MLLSTIATPTIGSSVGLALVRLEHLRPDMALVAKGKKEQSWKVEPWWADWWPERSRHSAESEEAQLYLDSLVSY